MHERQPMIPGLLEGKVALITGAGSGVGRAASLLFARHGARLVCADINKEWVDETAKLVEGEGGAALAVACNVVDEREVQAAIDAACEAYGRLDIVYNNVGVTGGPAPLKEATQAQFERLTAVNLGGVVNGCKLAVRTFERQGGGGAIVNTASVAGLIGWGGVIYGSTKGAVVALTRTLAIEVANSGIRVNSVCPAGMMTNFMNRGAPFAPPSPERVEAFGKMHPMGKPIDAMDCANAALFLASDLASNITGVNLPVDGGLSAG